MVIVPVGFDLGPVYAETGPLDQLPAHYEVHLGAQPRELTVEEYTVWSAAFTDADAQLELRGDRAHVERVARTGAHVATGEVADPAPVVDRLLREGLLLELDPEAGDALAEPFRTHHLYPRAEGLGSTLQLPDMYGIGYGSRRFCAVPFEVYQVWAFGLTAPSLWDACADLANGVDYELPAGEEPLNLTAAEVAGAVAENLPLLLSTKAGFLDLLDYELPGAPEPGEFPPRLAAPVPTSHTPVIVPVGLPLGWDFSDGDPASRPTQYAQVHLGIDDADLSVDEFLAWYAAGQDLDKQSNLEVTRESLVRHLEDKEGIAEAAEVVSGLLQRGLLVEFEPIEGPLRELFQAVQLYPLGDGLGSTPVEPDYCTVGAGGQPVVTLPAQLYAIWAYSLTCPSLWDACAAIATAPADEPTPDGVPPVPLDTEDVARGIGAVLPVMVAAGCTFLDPVSHAR